jgi:hypothetical protein
MSLGSTRHLLHRGLQPTAFLLPLVEHNERGPHLEGASTSLPAVRALLPLPKHSAHSIVTQTAVSSNSCMSAIRNPNCQHLSTIPSPEVIPLICATEMKRHGPRDSAGFTLLALFLLPVFELLVLPANGARRASRFDSDRSTIIQSEANRSDGSRHATDCCAQPEREFQTPVGGVGSTTAITASQTTTLVNTVPGASKLRLVSLPDGLDQF